MLSNNEGLFNIKTRRIMNTHGYVLDILDLKLLASKHILHSLNKKGTLTTQGSNIAKLIN